MDFPKVDNIIPTFGQHHMTFIFQAKYGLLTYAQCGTLDPFQVSDHLSGLGAECIIGREEHADGGTHLHAFFMFERKRAFRKADVFDVQGCHPNILRGIRSPEKMYDYATKDGDIVAGGLGRPSGSGATSNENLWHQLILCETREEFYQTIQDLSPRTLIVNFTSVRCYADWRYRIEPGIYESPGNVTFTSDKYPELDEFVQESLQGTGSGE